MSQKAIVLGITADHAFAAGALLASILAHDPKFDATVVIYHDDLPEDQQAAFLRLWPQCRFRRFTRDTVAARLGVAVDDPRVAPYFAHLSPLVLAKLELPDLLDDYAKVIWLDADILVRSPLDALWDFDCLAWRPLSPGAGARRAKVLELFADRGLDPSVPLLNGGVIGVARSFIDRVIDQGGSRQILHDIARQLVARAPQVQLAEMPWYLAAATLGLPVTPLDLRFNHPVASPGVSDAVVIHAIGPHKFWNATPLLHLFPDWAAHQARWVSCGGVPHAGALLLSETHPAEASAVLGAAKTRAYWLQVFDDLRSVLPKGMVPDLRHDRKFLSLFLYGRPASDHLRLVRMPSPRRMGLEVHLPEGLKDLALNAIDAAVSDLRIEKRNLLSIPADQVGRALAAAASVIPET